MRVFLWVIFMQVAPLSGTVRPPESLQPAIEALTEAGREWLFDYCDGNSVTPKALAKAADFERGELK